jgi:DNA repair protein RadC
MAYTLRTVQIHFAGETPAAVINAPAVVVEYLRPIFKTLDADREHFVILALNTKNSVTGFKVVSTGGVSATSVDAKTLFRDALGLGAASLVLAHSHPSGDPTPSRDDIALTRKLVAGGELLDVKIHDHVIMAGAAFVSFAERGLL